MNYLKKTLLNTWEFLRNTQAYFRDVLLMHGFILFGLLPLLSSSTKFILKRGKISYLSNENIGEILTQHPAVALLLGLTLLFILLAVFFRIYLFTFKRLLYSTKRSGLPQAIIENDLASNEENSSLRHSFLYFLFSASTSHRWLEFQF